MTLLEQARAGLNMVKEGRAAIFAVADAVRDGTVALSTRDQAELDKMLAAEREETREAHDVLDAAIQKAKQRS